MEGPSKDPEIERLRRQLMRAYLATLLLSPGVPMLVAGDEFGRTQSGNNNAYCQDNRISWLDWPGIDERGRAQIEFTRQLIALRREHIVFHRSRFFHSDTIPGTDVKDVVWLRPDGSEMAAGDWQDAQARALGIRLSGEAGLIHLTEHGDQELDDSFLIIMNGSHEDIAFRLRKESEGAAWRLLFDTFEEQNREDGVPRPVGKSVTVRGRSLQLYVLDHGETA